MSHKKDVLLQTYLEQPISVQLAGKKTRMSRRKAYFFRHAIQAAQGNLKSLEHLIQIGQKARDS